MPRKAIFTKDDICISMEPLPNTAISKFRYTLDCGGCERFCSFVFSSRERLSFVAVGKLANAFSSPCKRLGDEASATGARVGRLPLISVVNDAQGQEV